jgi:hypothetical protein
MTRANSRHSLGIGRALSFAAHRLQRAEARAGQICGRINPLPTTKQANGWLSAIRDEVLGNWGGIAVADLDPRLPREEEEEGSEWSRRQFLYATGSVAVAGAVALFGAQPAVNLFRSIFGSPVSSGLINVYQFDYYFVPNYVTWRVGDPVTIFLQNMSTVRWHEMQIGRDVSHVKTMLGTLSADGFDDDFWSGVPVVISDPYKIDNLTVGNSIPTYTAPKSEYALVPGGPFSPTLQPGGHIKLSFNVPDKPGIWNFACFVQHQAHYRFGMRGTINIIKA